MVHLFRTLAVLLGSCCVVAGQASAAGPFDQDTLTTSVLEVRPASPAKEEPRRWVAAVLALGLGPFGAHRLYLGTDTKVPIIYGITFGGFAVIPLIDLAHILFSKDLTPYEGNYKVLMWSGTRPELTPP